jgi:hypothetical protein
MRTPLLTCRLARHLACSCIALILLRKQRVLSVLRPTVVGVCGRFCRQTAVAPIDTVAQTNAWTGQALSRAPDDSRASGALPTKSVQQKRISIVRLRL